MRGLIRVKTSSLSVEAVQYVLAVAISLWPTSSDAYWSNHTCAPCFPGCVFTHWVLWWWSRHRRTEGRRLNPVGCSRFHWMPRMCDSWGRGLGREKKRAPNWRLRMYEGFKHILKHQIQKHFNNFIGSPISFYIQVPRTASFETGIKVNLLTSDYTENFCNEI